MHACVYMVSWVRLDNSVVPGIRVRVHLTVVFVLAHKHKYPHLRDLPTCLAQWSCACLLDLRCTNFTEYRVTVSDYSVTLICSIYFVPQPSLLNVETTVFNAMCLFIVFDTCMSYTIYSLYFVTTSSGCLLRNH